MRINIFSSQLIQFEERLPKNDIVFFLDIGAGVERMTSFMYA